MECVSFVLALSRRTRVFPPASVRSKQASKTTKVEMKNPTERHVSFKKAMMEDEKGRLLLVASFS